MPFFAVREPIIPRGRAEIPLDLGNLLDELGSEADVSKLGDRDRRRAADSKLAGVFAVEGDEARAGVLVGGKENLLVRREAEHAGDGTARGQGLEELELDAAGCRLARGAALARNLLDLEVRDGVGVVAREAVRDVDVLAVARDDDLSGGRGGGVGGREGGAVGAQLLGAGEGDAGAVVRDGEDLELVGQLAGEDEVSRLLRLGRVPGAVAGATAGGRDLVAGDDLVGVVLGVDDEDGVAAEVADGEESAGGVEDGLVGAVRVLALRVGAEGVVGLELLDKLQLLLGGDVPDIDLALGAARGSVDELTTLSVSLELTRKCPRGGSCRC